MSPQLICFSYHKSGTSLVLHVMTKVSRRLGLSLVNHYGLVERLDPQPDIVLLPHAVLRGRSVRPYCAIRLIRDPRDIWVSGYLYHLRCDEGWCRNVDMDPTPPILWPRVDYSVEHWPEAWKRRYLERLNGKSYQQNLLDRSLADGLDFELEGYTGCTLATMREWRLNGVDALDVRLEDVMADFDVAMLRIFDHFGFTAGQRDAALEVARSEDVRRMDDLAIAERPQIYSRTISKWRDVLPEAQLARFESRHGDLARELGYQPAATRAVRDADVWLSADGTKIRPVSVDGGIYRFVVPSGRARLTLHSRTGVQPCPGAAGRPRSVGLEVSEITISSDSAEVVVAADDPTLINGWYDAECEGSNIRRWTDGSAALPWGSCHGPVVVSIRCVARF